MRQNRRTFLRSTALASGALTLRTLASQARVPAGSGYPVNAESENVPSASIRRQFQLPPKKYRPLVRWWWPGNDVTDEELRREVEVLDTAGFGGAEIQAFVKGFFTKDLPDAQAQRVNSFVSPSFFRHVAVAIEEARK